MNSYEQKQEARRERLQRASDRASQESDDAYKRSHDMVSGIPFGQPILVGHHSERRHRNALDKSWNAMGKSVALDKKAKDLQYRANGVGTGGISSDDPEAVVKLKEKLEMMETAHAFMKKANAAYRKAKKPGPDDEKGWEMVAEITGKKVEYFNPLRDTFRNSPYLQKYGMFSLTNNNANMKSVKDRIKTLESRQTESKEYTKGDVRVVENVDENRIQLFFDDIPTPEIRTYLKRNGFKFSKYQGNAWQRHLNNAGKYAVACFLESELVAS